MATVITNGKQTVKLYQSVHRGQAMHQLAFYTAGRCIQKNFKDKAQAKRAANQILGGLTHDAAAVDALATPCMWRLRSMCPRWENLGRFPSAKQSSSSCGTTGPICHG